MQKSNDVTEIRLFLWSEVVGTYHGLSITDCYIHLKINDKTLSLPKDSIEAQSVQEILNDHLIGRKIAVLRTDIPEKPLCIRLAS